MLDTHDLLAQVLPRRRLQDVQLEHGPAYCQGAGCWKGAVESDGRALHLDGIAETAPLPCDLVRDRRGHDRRVSKDGAAFLRIPLQTTELVAGQPIRLIPNAERREGVQRARYHDEPLTDEQTGDGTGDQTGDQEPAQDRACEARVIGQG